MNREQRRIARENEAKQAKLLEEQAFKADVLKKAEICRKFVNDKRHEAYRSLWNDIEFNAKFKELLSLTDKVTSSDEFVRKGIALISEMNMIQKIFHKHNVFLNAAEEIEVREKADARTQ